MYVSVPQPHKRRYAHELPPEAAALPEGSALDLLAAVRLLRPTALIGVSAQVRTARPAPPLASR